MKKNRIRVVLLIIALAATAVTVSLATARGVRQTEPDDEPHPDEATAEQEAEQEKTAAYQPAADRTLISATGPVTAPLFIGVDDTTVPAYQVDVDSNQFYTAFVGAELYGAAYDPVLEKVYFNEGNMLYEWSLGGGAPTSIGVISDAGGSGLSMVGLAFYDGSLYGTRNVADEAVYKIDLDTLVATVQINYEDTDYDFGGFAADPNSGTFYATNDDTSLDGRGLYQIDPDGTITLVAPYPDGQSDIDGLAVSEEGFAYLVTDEPGSIYVYDFNTMTYTTPLTNPWTTSEIFSAGAWLYDINASVDFTKTVGTDPTVCAPTDTISVTAGTEVTYCYFVTNTGEFTFTVHNLVDDQFGPLLTSFPFTLSPDQTVWLTTTTTIHRTTANTASWSASEFSRYTLDDNASYNFIDISGTGTPLNLSDDGEENVTMPFNFIFFGQTSNQIRVANNGGLLFDDTTGNIFAGNDPLPTTDFQMAILPFWDDLDNNNGNVYYQTMGTAPNRQFIVQWHNRPHFDNSSNPVTFQVVLSEGSNEILFQYQDIDFNNASWDFGASATVGLQESDTAARQYSHNTASLANGMAIRYTPVNVEANADDTARVNVEPEIEINPSAVSSSQLRDTVMNKTLSISNIGTAELNWRVYEQAPTLKTAAADPPPTNQPAISPPRPVLTSTAECALYENYTGLEPHNYTTLCLDDIPAPPAAADGRTPQDVTDTAYALDIGTVSDNFVSHQLNDFPGQTVLGTNERPILAMDFDATATTLYAIDNASRELGTLDLGSGTFITIATISGIPPADNISGLAIDPLTNEAYVSALSASMDLYSLDLATGAATLIGSDSSVNLLIDITISPNGIMYGHDIGTDSIYTIDRSSGTATLIGPTGFDATFAQAIDFDNATGTLYAWLYQGGGSNIYGTIDPATGQLTPLTTSNPQGEFEGAVQNAGCDPLDIPWLSINQTAGTVLPSESNMLELTFDSTGLTPGTYTGTLCLTSNDLQTPLIIVPLTLTVENEADLSLTQSDTPDPVQVGEMVTYLLTVQNGGPDLATGVTLTDTLPSEVTFVSATAGCSETAGVVVCSLGNLADGSATVEIQVTVPKTAATLSNTAIVSSSETDPNESDNAVTVTTTVKGSFNYLPLVTRQ